MSIFTIYTFAFYRRELVRKSHLHSATASKGRNTLFIMIDPITERCDLYYWLVGTKMLNFNNGIDGRQIDDDSHKRLIRDKTSFDDLSRFVLNSFITYVPGAEFSVNDSLDHLTSREYPITREGVIVQGINAQKGYFSVDGQGCTNYVMYHSGRIGLELRTLPDGTVREFPKLHQWPYLEDGQSYRGGVRFSFHIGEPMCSFDAALKSAAAIDAILTAQETGRIYVSGCARSKD